MQQIVPDDVRISQYYTDIVVCLVIYGGLQENVARTLLAESELFDPDDLNDQSYRGMLFHELPYYWAMSLLYGPNGPHARQDHWWQDPALWPPPNELAHPDWPNNVLQHQSQ